MVKIGAKYLDDTGLAYFWSKIKNYVQEHGGGGSVYNDLKWVDFQTAPDSFATGSKTYTMTIPSGYEPVTNKPFEIFSSGHAQVYITDRTMAASGSTLTISYYLYNPVNATNIVVFGSVLFKKKEIEAEISYRDTIIEQQNITYSNGWTTVSKTGYKLVSAYAVRDDASYNIQINKRTSGIYTLFASGAGNSTQLTEFTWVKETVSRDVAPSVDLIYPVGAIYMSTNSTSPESLFGGTWVQIEDRFLLAAGSTYTAGASGGAATVTLTAAQSGVPAHGHTYTRPTVVSGAGGHSHTITTKYNTGKVATGTGTFQVASGGSSSTTGVSSIASNTGTHSHTLTGGGVAQNTAANASQAHNNMPPYLVVYVWERTA